METTTATGLTRRPLTADDLDDVAALLTASDTAVLGWIDFTPDDIADDLRRDDLEAYGWYAGDTLVGYAWVARVDTTSKVEIDVYVHPDHDASLGHDIVSFLEERARALAADAGHTEAVLDLGVYRQDERTQSWLRAHGFTTGTSFVRMRIDLDGPVDALPPGPGVVVRRSDRTEDDLRLAHRISEAAFAEHYGHVDTAYDTFRARLTDRGADWADLWFADVDGEPVGALVATRQFEPDENAGYVRTLGVLDTARGRGAGKALLRAYFDHAQRAGRTAVLLHVDVANVTDALRLYESVGMRSVLTIDAWAKRSSVRAD